MIPAMCEEVQTFADSLASKNGQPVVLADTMNDLSLSMIIRLGFGGDFDKKWMKKECVNILHRFPMYSILASNILDTWLFMEFSENFRTGFLGINRF